MIFYNQTKSPKGEIIYNASGNKTVFSVNLSLIPQNIKKLVLAVTIDGSGNMSMIQNQILQIKQNTQTVLELVLNACISCGAILEALNEIDYENKTIFYTLILGAKLGVASDGELNEKEKMLIDTVFDDIWSGSNNDLYELIGLQITEEVQEHFSYESKSEVEDSLEYLCDEGVLYKAETYCGVLYGLA